MFCASSRLVAKIVAAMPNWKFAYSSRQRLHRVDRLARLVEAALDVPDLIVDVADAVERDADADQQIVLGAELHDAGEHRDGAMRRQAGGVDADLAHPRQVALEHLHHLRQVVARRRLAAGDVQVLDGAPERMAASPARAAPASCRTCGRRASSCCTSRTGRRRPRCSCRSARSAGSASASRRPACWRGRAARRPRYGPGTGA